MLLYPRHLTFGNAVTIADGEVRLLNGWVAPAAVVNGVRTLMNAASLNESGKRNGCGSIRTELIELNRREMA